ncbi:Elongation of very long chain fatty acids protein 6 [Melipona quadrifasciata]|uniref:Elongation of very long chain fatty acids protein n=1 Tax=Melipona quadrifasciata TaxID=166423 RepID=A0A0N0U353_9HYME|nr:Elongation of very long chain fatty acids protein 6 [Melipona quadrifasciata]
MGDMLKTIRKHESELWSNLYFDDDTCKYFKNRIEPGGMKKGTLLSRMPQLCSSRRRSSRSPNPNKDLLWSHTFHITMKILAFCSGSEQDTLGSWNTLTCGEVPDALARAYLWDLYLTLRGRLRYESVHNISYKRLRKNFDYKQSQIWMKDHFLYCSLCCVLYAILIFVGKYYMSNRPKYDLRSVLALWNASFALFSIIAVCKTVPAALSLPQYHGFYYTTCVADVGTKNSILRYWGYLFTLSKLVEFGDRVFIVLRKQPLIFLHWYHHIVKFLYITNICGHFFSYGNLLPYYVYIAKIRYHISSLNMTITIIMYISYAILFARFFI